MDDLLAQFLIEGRDLVAQAHDATRLLDRDGEDKGAVDALFRAVHTLKGSVALFDMAPAETALHATETLLGRVRREGTGLAGADRRRIVAVVDQVDRWIDAMESDGCLPDEASTLAGSLVADLEDEEPPAATGRVEWLDAMLVKPHFAGRVPPAGGTAFRYTPDPDCFFRGDDPLAVVAAVPGLIAFKISPKGAWPPVEDADPFRCSADVEGLSSADLEQVRAAFRLVPDQIALAELQAGGRSDADCVAEFESAATMLRVEGAKLDRLARQAGELAVAIHGLERIARRVEVLDRSLAAELRRAQAAIDGASGALRASIAQVRLVSLAPVLRRLPRLARETADLLGKEIRFTLTGDATEADKQIADALFEPLLHLVRNAIDHGIEPPQERAGAGKPPEGAIDLTIAAHGDRLLVSLVDDGRGMDPRQLGRTAVAKGLIAPDTMLSDAQALRLIFAPGFSTTENISTVSGRGIGMDAVQRVVERLQGTIDIESEAGAGTQVRISLPLNAITTRLLTVSAGGERFGIRLDQIRETVRVDADAIHAVGQGKACVIRDRTVPVIDLGVILGRCAARGRTALLVVTGVTGEPVALRVEALGERMDAMVREGKGLLASLAVVGGTAVLADGGVLLVLDLTELVA